MAELAIDVGISQVSISVDSAQKEDGTPIQLDVLKFQTRPQTTQKFLEQLKPCLFYNPEAFNITTENL